MVKVVMRDISIIWKKSALIPQSTRHLSSKSTISALINLVEFLLDQQEKGKTANQPLF